MRNTNTVRFPAVTPLAALLAVSLTACQGADASKISQEAQTAAPQRSYDPSKLSCNPFGGGAPIYYNQGLNAQLYYLRDGQPNYSNVNDMIANGTHLDVDLFFSDVNVPTRLFSQGFPSQAGPLLRTAEDRVLVEWFALRYKSVVRLGPNDRAGQYQFAILADDGAMLRADLNGNGIYQDVVNDDGLHPSKVACAPHSVRMDSSTQMPIQLDYYQGPRYHIANILMWREVDSSVDEATHPEVLADAACGVAGNDTWFNFNVTPTVPRDPFIQMLNRGWKVMSADNFLLPYEAPVNPCCTTCGLGV